ncbi:unnamed protein product [Vitrella brassicaformis CCMP3155]|uniref:Plasma membrane ATPase n=3 Tax=Vitrella brassicaformis TaxID=1169539 RepID=A0A0G4FJA8_VITBC|nr:unnamed protein product [Vitrella brassicaformis CCMP3155]|mmetsp:Transcript_16487/g.39583  ORF Transcript_16487/g.39583 Transcript_16487/m.39583 type:complete len:1004 (+) Transcript_16487:295-3306(+)|eukprot:CEM13152.1 unnamed protein product [Vitrella brassicaformis CCMP3155]
MAEVDDIKVNLDGLSDEEVAKLRAIHGYNEVTPKETPEWVKIAKRFTGIVPIIMMITAVLGVAVPDPRDPGNIAKRDWMSFALLVFELLLVVVVDYYSDKNAGNAIKAVKDLSAPECECKRNGKWEKVKVRELVPGDICFLGGGVVIPADGKLVGEGEPVQIDEAALTGEALAVTKRVGDEVLAGAVVQSGELDMMVTKTGENSFFGKTLALLGSVQEEGHLKKTLGKVAKTMALIGLFFCVIIFIVRIARSERENRGDFVAQTVKLCFVILTAVVPIAMPVVTTTVLSVGALELSKESAVVTRLSAIEEMAGIEVLCSDKTGTLTLNKLTLDKDEITCGEGFTGEYVLVMASLASKLTNQEPIDKAITAATDLSQLEKYKVTKFIPFNPVDKKTESTVLFPDGTIKLISKGAPHVIRNMVAVNYPEMAEKMEGIINGKAERGLRTLGVCWSDPETIDWQFVGLISLFDPPRDDTKHTIEQSMEYGVDVKMVTGDQRAIAIETARRLGMGTNIIGNEIWSTESSLVEQRGGLGEFIMSVNGFAGVYPEHKFKIVAALQDMGKLVGMTGDGVNDAPALKKANVGVAVAGATDAAKGAADIILLQPGLSTIVTALLTSRTIFQRIQNYIMYRMASSSLILFFFVLSICAAEYDFPTWTLILLSLINDFTIMSTSKDNVVRAGVPQHWDLKKVLIVAGTLGFTNVIGAFLGLFLFADGEQIAGGINWWKGWGVDDLLVYRKYDGSECNEQISLTDDECEISIARLNAAVYLNLAVMIQLNIFSTRTKSWFWYYDGVEAKPPSIVVIIPVIASMVLSSVLMLIWPGDLQFGGGAPVEGIRIEHVAIVWLYSFIWFFLGDILKVLILKKFYSDDADSEDMLFGSVLAGEKTKEQIQQEVKKQLESLRREFLNKEISKDGVTEYLKREEKSHELIRKRTSENLSVSIGSPPTRPSGLALVPQPSQPSPEMIRIEKHLKNLTAQVQALTDWKEALIKTGALPREPKISDV